MACFPLNSKVLMLGAGFVTKPTLDILSDSGISVTVGTYCLILLLDVPQLSSVCDTCNASGASGPS